MNTELATQHAGHVERRRRLFGAPDARPPVVIPKAASRPVSPFKRPPPPPKPYVAPVPVEGTWQAMAEALALECGYPVTLLLGSNRAGYLMGPRAELAFRLHVEFDMTIRQLADIFRRDHSSCSHLISRHIASTPGAEEVRNAVLESRTETRAYNRREAVRLKTNTIANTAEIAGMLGVTEDFVKNAIQLDRRARLGK